MFILTVVIITSGIVIALALAATSSRPGGADSRDVLHEDEHIRPINMAPKPFTTSHQGVSTETRPVISAAGMQ
jgi:hypothetical protein